MQALTERYQPNHLADFAGLQRPRALLAHLAAHPYESAWLFLGPSGTGKTTMALALASEMGAELHHIASKACDLEAVNRIVHDCFYTPWSGEWHMILVDEADNMSRAAQLAFLSKLDSTARPPKTIFIFTANDTALLEDRFLSRCRTLHFQTADILEPAAALLARIWEAEAPGTAAPDFREIVQDAGLNVRAALMDLELEIIAPGTRPKAAPDPSSVVPINSKPAPFHCPMCNDPSGNKQGVVSHLRQAHGITDKAARDSLMAAAGM